MRRNSFFARKEQSQFIQRVYREAPSQIQGFFQTEGEMLRQALSGMKSVLEIGCGFGRALQSVPEECSYSGIDIGFSYVLEGRAKHKRGNWICADATKLPFANVAFDAVFCIQNTLGNMEGIEPKVVAECKRVCRQRLLVSVYSEDSFETRRLWYDRLVDIGIFGNYWLDPQNSRIARSNTGWSSRCFGREELQQLIAVEKTQITKIGSFFYFCAAEL